MDALGFRKAFKKRSPITIFIRRNKNYGKKSRQSGNRANQGSDSLSFIRKHIKLRIGYLTTGAKK
jgi:hypothetical protein